MDEEDPFYDHDHDLQPETKHSTKKKAGRTKSTDNVRVVEMRKERSRNAARNRRGKENAQFDELAKLLPLPAAITSQLDKASIIRLTISYLSMREFSGLIPQKQITDGSESSPLSETASDAVPPGSPTPGSSNEIVPFKKNESPETQIPLNDETGTQLLHALEGFLLVLAEDGKILYVSETVSINLGLSQVELTGGNIYNYVNVEDHGDLMDQLRQASSTETNEPPFQSGQDFFSCQSSSDSGSGLFSQGDAIGPGTLPLHQPRAFFLRMKCTLVRRGGSYAKSTGFKVVHCVGRIKNYASDKQEASRKAFVMLVQPVPTMNINELPLECNMFVSRVNMDLKIVYCEGRIHKFMDYLAKDIVGISAYDFYHAGDVALIQGHHAKFLSKGQVWTKYYRWMNKNGGWVWMQTKASLIPHPTNPGLKQMLCLNYILSDVEHRSVVLGMAQLKDKPEFDSSTTLTELPCEADTSGELSDALIDDQVMVFPKWHATSDKLVPEQTVLDQMALQRTGYNTQFDESLKTWSKHHSWIDNPSDHESSPENDIDDKDLQDIVDIIESDMSTFDRSLIDFVVCGNTQSIYQATPSQLGPIGAYIEEIPETATELQVGNLVTKVEDDGIQNDFGSLPFCSQAVRNTSEFPKSSNSVKPEGPGKRPASGTPYNYGTTSFGNTIPSKIPRLSHMQCVNINMSGNKMYNKPGRSTATITVLPDTQDNDPYQMPSSSTSQGSSTYTGTATATATSTSTKPKVPYPQGSEQAYINLSDDRRMPPPPVATSPNSYQSSKPKASRKPKTLLEQLASMPGKDSDVLSDDMMFDLVESLLGDSIDDSDKSRTSQGFGNDFESNGSGLSTLIPRQEIKQEVVTPTSTEPQTPFSDCFQNMSNFASDSQMKPPGLYQRIGPLGSPGFSSGLESVKPEAPVSLASANMNRETSETRGNVSPDSTGCSPYRPSASPQPQWGTQQQTQLLRQPSWQQHQQPQQQESAPEIPLTQRSYQVQQQGTRPQTGTQSFSQQQARFQQQKLQQQNQQHYELLRSQQQQQQQQQQLKQQQQQQLKQQQQQLQQQQLQQQQQQLNQQQQQQRQQQQQQQQRHQMRPSSSTTSYTQQSILRELNELIQKNNNIQSTSNFNPQSLTISSAPLPELGNGLDDELNTLPMDQQTQHSSSISNQNYNNGSVGTDNFTGMM